MSQLRSHVSVLVELTARSRIWCECSTLIAERRAARHDDTSSGPSEPVRRGWRPESRPWRRGRHDLRVPAAMSTGLDLYCGRRRARQRLPQQRPRPLDSLG